MSESAPTSESPWLLKRGIGKYIPIGLVAGIVFTLILTSVLFLTANPERRDISYSSLIDKARQEQVVTFSDAGKTLIGTYVDGNGNEINYRVKKEKLDSDHEKLFDDIPQPDVFTYLLIGSFLCTALGFFLALKIVSSRYGSGSIRKDFNFYIQGWDIPYGFAMGLICQLVSLAILLPIVQLSDGLSDQINEQTNSLIIHGGWGEVASFVAIVILAPIFEELFFRGLVMGWLSARVGDSWGLVWSAVIFGLVHVFTEPIGVLALVGVGLILGYTYRSRGRLGPAIVAHATFNLFTFLAMTRAV